MTTQSPAPQLALIALSACPFCGGDAHLDITGHVACKSGWPCGHTAYYNSGTPQERNAAAITAWNTRPQSRPEAELPEVVERVARAMHASENKTSGWTWEECSPIEIEGWNELAQAAIAAYGQQCAATRPGNEVAPLGLSQEDLCRIYTLGYRSGHNDTVEGEYIDVTNGETGTYFADVVNDYAAELGANRPAEVGGDGGSENSARYLWLRDVARQKGLYEALGATFIGSSLDEAIDNYRTECPPAPGSEAKS